MSMRLCFTSHLANLNIEHARMAVWSWLLTRHDGGTFWVRGQNCGQIEALCAELRQLGIDWDEDPICCAERVVLYRRLAMQLIAYGHAYERDGAIWFRIQRAGPMQIDDLLLRTLVFEHSSLDDPLLIAAEGTPSPLWADVADEHLLGVTHVIGHADRLADLPYRVQLHRALGRLPQYLHLPSVITSGRMWLNDLQAEGYFPLALVNAIATLGWTPRGRRRLHHLDELIAQFDLEHISRHATKWDITTLDDFNRRYLSQLDLATLSELLVPYWQTAFGTAHRADDTGMTPTAWQQLLTRAIRSELHRPAQAVELARAFFDDRFPVRTDAIETLTQPYAPDVLRAFTDGISTLEPFAYDPLNEFVSALRYRFKASHGIRSRDAMFVIRAALTGRLDGPCLIEACLLLGRARCLERATRRAVCPDRLCRPFSGKQGHDAPCQQNVDIPVA